MKTDLQSLSLDELRQLRNDVDKAISEHEKRQREEALAALERKAEEFGFSLGELTGRQRPVRRPLPPKYRHPGDPAKTWSGRGRQPAWFRDALEAGTSVEDLEIK